MALAGYTTTLKVPGEPVALTDEPLTALGSGAFRVTNAAKRILDPGTALSVTVDGGATTYTVDYLYGVVTFSDGTPTTATLTGAYLPTLTVGEARSVSLSLSRVELDTNVFGTDESENILGKKSADGSLVSLRLTEDTVDVAGTLPTWDALHDNATPKLLEVGLGTEFWRGWVLFPGLQREAPSDGVCQSTINFKSSYRHAAGRSEVVAYGFGE